MLLFLCIASPVVCEVCLHNFSTKFFVVFFILRNFYSYLYLDSRVKFKLYWIMNIVYASHLVQYYFQENKCAQDLFFGVCQSYCPWCVFWLYTVCIFDTFAFLWYAWNFYLVSVQSYHKTENIKKILWCIVCMFLLV